MSRIKRKAESVQTDPAKRKRTQEPVEDANPSKTRKRSKKVVTEDSMSKPVKSRTDKRTQAEPTEVSKKKRGKPKTVDAIVENAVGNGQNPQSRRGKPKDSVKSQQGKKNTTAPITNDQAERPKSTKPSTSSKHSLKHANIDESVQYWLMKAEPESRIEKGHDVKFSIDDLQQRVEPEGWDGVRNYVARNNMRAMRKGDLGFFYHSNCKIPGIAGVLRIVEEHSVDESAFDPNHPYYDPKSSREKPKWDIVKVEFVKKFDELITLKDLRDLGTSGKPLENMQMLKQSRLSVSSVSPSEWFFLLEQAGENPDLGQAPKTDGYESDIDGEGEDNIVENHKVKRAVNGSKAS